MKSLEVFSCWFIIVTISFRMFSTFIMPFTICLPSRLLGFVPCKQGPPPTRAPALISAHHPTGPVAAAATVVDMVAPIAPEHEAAKAAQPSVSARLAVCYGPRLPDLLLRLQVQLP